MHYRLEYSEQDFHLKLEIESTLQTQRSLMHRNCLLLLLSDSAVTQIISASSLVSDIAAYRESRNAENAAKC